MNKKTLFLIYITTWLFALGAIFLIISKFAEPLYREETQSTAAFSLTEPLYPGDSITQPFIATDDSLSTVEIALSYGESLSETTTMSLSLYRGDTLVMEQPLSVKYCPNQTFFRFYANQKDCLGETFSITVRNTTDSSSADEAQTFRLMSTSQEHSYLTNTSNYSFNDTMGNERLFCRFTYQTGYNCYKAFTYAFWVLLCAMFLTMGFTRLYHQRSAESQ